MKDYLWINETYPGLEITIRAPNEDSADDMLEAKLKANSDWLEFTKWGLWEIVSVSE